MNIPGQVRVAAGTGATPGEKTAERRRRRRDTQRTLRTGPPAWLAFTRSPRYLGVLAVVFVLLGILLVTQAGRHQPAAGLTRLTVAQWLTGRVGMNTVTSPRQRTDESLATLRTALELFHRDCQRYPSNREGLAALIRRPKSAPGWDGPYVKALWPDPWKNAYRYAITNGIVGISSCGPDGRPDTADDVFAPPPDMSLVNRITAPTAGASP